MPIQCDICEYIRMVPMLLDMPLLRWNKSPYLGTWQHSALELRMKHFRTWPRRTHFHGKIFPKSQNATFLEDGTQGVL